MLFACRRSVHLEVRQYKGRTNSKFMHISLPEACNNEEITLLADVYSCSQHGVVAARITSVRPDCIISLSKTFTVLRVR